MAIHIAIILTDSQRNILWVNEDFTRLTGYNLQEVIGKKPSLLQGPGSEQSVIKRLREGLRQNIAVKETITNYRKNGEPYACTLVIHPIFDSRHNLTNFIAFEVDANKVSKPDEISLLQVHSKYRASTLDQVESDKLYYNLCHLMRDKKIFLDPQLNLAGVAAQLNTNTKYLSQVINQRTDNNFNRFVNGFRVNKAKENLKNPEFHNLTHYGVALKCGFRNKSTFYKVFKELTNLTPAEYVERTQTRGPLKDSQRV